jgi:soluble lytic murein transglycosylase-like protein
VTSIGQVCAVLLAAASLAGCGAHVPLPFLQDAEPAKPTLTGRSPAPLSHQDGTEGAVPIAVVAADKNLEDNDPIEPADAGMVPAVIAAGEHAFAPGEQGKFVETFGLIRRHAATYNFDPLLIAAQGFQESGLDQSKRSPLGAIGIMQVMPSTARDPNVGISDIHIAERNVEAGVKYLRFVHDRYFSDPALSPLDRTLFSFAAYNAGPGNIAKARQHAEELGLDPNVWFDSVELAAARVISREPVIYVRNILRFYASYQLSEERRAAAGG